MACMQYSICTTSTLTEDKGSVSSISRQEGLVNLKFIVEAITRRRSGNGNNIGNGGWIQRCRCLLDRRNGSSLKSIAVNTVRVDSTTTWGALNKN
jgi:hypothetical protein